MKELETKIIDIDLDSLRKKLKELNFENVKRKPNKQYI